MWGEELSHNHRCYCPVFKINETQVRPEKKPIPLLARKGQQRPRRNPSKRLFPKGPQKPLPSNPLRNQLKSTRLLKRIPMCLRKPRKHWHWCQSGLGGNSLKRTKNLKLSKRPIVVSILMLPYVYWSPLVFVPLCLINCFFFLGGCYAIFCC